MPAVVTDLKELIEIAVDQATEAEDDLELDPWRPWLDATVEQVSDGELRLTVGGQSYRIMVTRDQGNAQ